MPEPLVIREMRAHRAALLRQDARQMASMARRWRQVEFALQDEIELLARRVADDKLSKAQKQEARYLAERSQSLLRQTRREMGKYTEYLEPLIQNEQERMARAGIAHAASNINAVASEAGVTIQFDRLPVAAVENMVGLAGDGSPLTTLLESSYGAGVDGMFTELIRGVALGKNPRETAARMVREGLSQSLNRMMVIARTEQLRVYRESSRAAYIQSGVVSGYKRLSAKDGRTCMGCLMADGRRYELTQPLDEHPAGRCSLVPIVNGMPPIEWETGPDWFQKQEPAMQKNMMGSGRFAAWKDGKFDLDQLVSVRRNATWGDSLQPTSLRDLVGGERRPAPVRIVEPSRFSFSGDVEALRRANFTQERITRLFDIGTDANATIAVSRFDNAVEVAGSWRDKTTGELIGECTRRLFPGEKKAYLDLLSFEPKYIGNGAGIKVARDWFDALGEAGYEKAELYAGLTIGRYAWAKEGAKYLDREQAARSTLLFREWTAERGIVLDEYPTFTDVLDVATYRHPQGQTLTGKDIKNRDVPPDMVLPLGKAFMLDVSFNGHGGWNAVIDLKNRGR